MGFKLTKRSKYHNIKTVVDGVTFDSRKEAARYVVLKELERAGKIRELQLQPRYELVVKNVRICRYVGDFRYYDCATNKYVVEDAKGVLTPVNRLKKKLMKVLYGITITEV